MFAFLKEIGLEGVDVVFKSDQENAIGDLLNNIAKRRSALSKMETADEEEVPSHGAAPQGMSLALSMKLPRWEVLNRMGSLRELSRTRKVRFALSSRTWSRESRPRY